MSRLYLRLQDAFAAEPLTLSGLRRILDDLVDSQRGLSGSARVVIRYEHLLRRRALASDNGRRPRPRGAKERPPPVSSGSMRTG